MVTGKFLNIDDNLLKIVELKVGTKEPKHSLDTVLDIGNEPNDYAYIVPKGYIVLDFDYTSDNKNEEIYLNKYKENTTYFKTENGIHLWYKIPQELENVNLKNGVKVSLFNGLVCDVKVGGRKAMVTIRRNNKDRECFNAKMNIPELPFELYPTYHKIESFTQINAGERNNYFFKLIGGISKFVKNARLKVTNGKIVGLIKSVNDLIDNPFTAQEFNKEIPKMVSVALDKQSSGKKSIEILISTNQLTDEKSAYYLDDNLTKLNTNKIAQYLLWKFDIYYYRHKLYFHQRNLQEVKWFSCERHSTSALIGRYLVDYLDISISMHQQNDIFDKIVFNLHDDNFLEDNYKMPIVTKNGYVITQDCKIYEDFSQFSDNVIDCEFIKDANDSQVLEFLNFVSMNNPQIINVLIFMLGHILTTTNVPQLGYFLVGQKGGNGKTTFTTCVSNFLGLDNISTSSLEQLTEEDTHKYSASRSLVNVADDVDGSYIESSHTFKTFTGGSNVSVRELYENPIKVTPYCTLISSCNIMPTFKEISGGMDRRVVIVPFRNYLKDSDRNPNLINILSTKTAKATWLNLALMGLKYVRENNGVLPYCEEVIKAGIQYKLRRDSVLNFIYYSCDIDVDTIVNEDSYDSQVIEFLNGKNIKTLYEDYKTFCIDDGIKNPVYKNRMIATIKDKYRLRVVTRDKQQMFVVDNKLEI